MSTNVLMPYLSTTLDLNTLYVTTPRPQSYALMLWMSTGTQVRGTFKTQVIYNIKIEAVCFIPFKKNQTTNKTK